MSSTIHGAVAAGHSATVAAAAAVLRAGGNAFDAVVAAQWCACVTEPVLTSLGGGGFLLAQSAGGDARVYDFFVHTPQRKRPRAELDFAPIDADFGTAVQEFHIGWGAAATPGTVRGLFGIQRALCRLPMRLLLQPAIDLARRGVRVNALQAYIFDVVRPIYLRSEAAARIFASRARPDRLVDDGELLRLPQLADTLEALGREGEALFYDGAIAALIDAACRHGGGQLRRDDLAAYRMIERRPLTLDYRHARLLTNPPPASGGLLLGFGLQLLQRIAPGGFDLHAGDSPARLAQVMQASNEARLRSLASGHFGDQLLDREQIELYRAHILGRARAYRGTTHISVIDAAGNLAALTSSNGEGCGHMLGDSGIMLNNMLGEADLNPLGFQQWTCDQRMTSMMAPGVIATADGRRIALGSGGSNRIRSALLQVTCALVDAGLPLEAAILYPRMHCDDGIIHTEADADRAGAAALADFGVLQRWPERNLYFGGVHAVAYGPTGFEGCGDPRRGGVAEIVVD